MRVLGPQNSQGVLMNAGHDYSWLLYMCVCSCILLLVISVGVVEDYMSTLEGPQPCMRGCSQCGRIRGDLGREGGRSRPAGGEPGASPPKPPYSDIDL